MKLQESLQELRNLNESLEKMSAAQVEFAAEVARAVVPESIRNAVRAAAGTKGTQHKASGGVKMVEAHKSMRREGEVAKRLKAMQLGTAPAGVPGIITDFHAIGQLREFVQDYIQVAPIRGTELRVQSVGSDVPFVASGVGEQDPKPERVQQLRTLQNPVGKIAVTTAYTEEAFRVFGDDVYDYLALQLTIDVLEFIDRGIQSAIALTSLPFIPAPFAGYTGAPSPNIIDLLYAMYFQESELTIYNSARSRDEEYVVLLGSRDYYSGVRLRDAQNRPLYRDWNEAFPIAPVVQYRGVVAFTRPAVIFRPSRYFLGMQDDVLIYSDRMPPLDRGSGIGDLQDRNLYYMTVEVFSSFGYTLRADTTTGSAGYSRIVTNASPIIPTL